MQQLFRILHNCLQTEDAVLVTVVAGSGSTPRGAGAAMIVTKNGRQTGTIGGGAVEYRSEQMAAEILENKTNRLHDFTLTANQVEDLGMICGGSVTVYFRYLAAKDPAALALSEKIDTLFQQQTNTWLLMQTDGPAWGLYSKADGFFGITIPEDLRPKLLKNRAVQAENYYSQPLIRSGRVILFGGGHVAQELVPLLAHLGFPCIVIDDRPEFTKPALFPTAAQIILGDFNRIHDFISLSESDYAVIMTRGHAFDYIVERQVHQTPASYIGVIGSRTKMKKVFANLLADGVPQAKLDLVHTPIGTAIKAETPAEIAISIAGELIQVRAERYEIF